MRDSRPLGFRHELLQVLFDQVWIVGSGQAESLCHAFHMGINDDTGLAEGIPETELSPPSGVVMLSTVLGGRVPNAKRFILSSPALKLKVKVPAWKASLAMVLSKIAPKLTMSNEVDPGTVSRIPEIVEAYRTDPLVHSKISSRLYGEWQSAAAESLDRAGEIKIPFLILAGTDDRLIDPVGSRELNAKAPLMSELHLLQGRYHEPFNDVGSDEAFAMIAEWLRK